MNTSGPGTAEPAARASPSRWLTRSLLLAADRRGIGGPAQGSRLQPQRFLLPDRVRQKERGVDARVVQADGPVQMRSCDASRLSDHAYPLAARHLNPLDDVDAA